MYFKIIPGFPNSVRFENQVVAQQVTILHNLSENNMRVAPHHSYIVNRKKQIHIFEILVGQWLSWFSSLEGIGGLCTLANFTFHS